jgi:hypothetical protein
MVQLYLHSLIRHHDMVLNSISTGPTLPLPLNVILIKINCNFHTNLLLQWKKFGIMHITIQIILCELQLNTINPL